MTYNLIDRIKLPFRKEKELCSSLYDMMGFFPHDISFYKLALVHKSAAKKNVKGRSLNNERLEFLGDAILDAIVGDIVYRHFEGKHEGFLTNTRSKIVQRETLNKLAQEMGLEQLIKSAGHSSSHNSYMGGNAFEALVGAIYLDRGYDFCMRFMEKRILVQLINIDKVAYKEVNFKSKLIEWSQKNRVNVEFRMLEQGKEDNGSPTFNYQVFMEGLEGGKGTGYSKKESQQKASKETLERLRREPQFIDNVFAEKTKRTQQEEEPVENVPDTEEDQSFIITTNSNKNAEAESSDRVKDEKETDVTSRDRANTQRKKARRTKATLKSARENGSEVADNRVDAKGSDNKAADNARDIANDKTTTPSRHDAGLKDNENAPKDEDDSKEFDLSDITHTPKEKSIEDIIAEAEKAAFAEGKE